MLKDHHPSDLLDSINSSTNIAFPHPNPEYDEEICIFIGGNMPHWVKEFRNAMDNTKTQDLGFLGVGFILVPLKESWKKVVDCDIGICADICVYKSSTGHFELNSYNKIRVFLAIHICSQTVI